MDDFLNVNLQSSKVEHMLAGNQLQGKGNRDARSPLLSLIVRDIEGSTTYVQTENPIGYFLFS